MTTYLKPLFFCPPRRVIVRYSAGFLPYRITPLRDPSLFIFQLDVRNYLVHLEMHGLGNKKQ